MGKSQGLGDGGQFRRRHGLAWRRPTAEHRPADLWLPRLGSILNLAMDVFRSATGAFSAQNPVRTGAGRDFGPLNAGRDRAFCLLIDSHGG